MTSCRRGLGQCLGDVAIALAAVLLATGTVASAQTTTATDEAVKAALLYNFAKFVEWPRLASAAPLIVCISGDEGIAAAFVTTVNGRNISGHGFNVWRPQNSSAWPACQMLFLAGAETGRSSAGLAALRGLPVLTVSDGKGFAQADGIIELYIEEGRMRFAINVDAAGRSTLRVSSRLLGLARIIRSPHVQ